MPTIAQLLTVLSAWVLLSIPSSLLAGHFLASQEKRYLMARITLLK